MAYIRSTRSSYKNISLPEDCIVTLSDVKPNKQMLVQARNDAVDKLRNGKLVNFSCSFEESPRKFINHQILFKNEDEFLLVCELSYYSLTEYKKLYPHHKITKDRLPQITLMNGECGMDYPNTIKFICESLKKPYKFFGDVDYEGHKLCRDLTDESSNPCSLYTRYVVDKKYMEVCYSQSSEEIKKDDSYLMEVSYTQSSKEKEIEDSDINIFTTSLFERLKRKYGPTFVDLTKC